MTTGLVPRSIEQLISAALAAPSMHNSQPWRFSLSGEDRLDIRVDWHRLVPISDPDGRGLRLATGAALLNMRLVARTFGREPVIRLRPEPADAGLLARFEMRGQATATGDEQTLAEMIFRRHTNRRPFRDVPIPEYVRARLVEAAHAEGATLFALGLQETERILGLVRHADRVLRTDPLYVAELAYWTGTSQRRVDGIPRSAMGPLIKDQSLPLRDFGLALPNAMRPLATFEREPAIFLLSTPDDRPDTWLRAGLALQRVLLVATAHELSASFLYQPLQIALFRSRLRAVMGRRTYPQMIMRLGYGQRVAGAPRRRVTDVLGSLDLRGDVDRSLPTSEGDV